MLANRSIPGIIIRKNLHFSCICPHSLRSVCIEWPTRQPENRHYYFPAFYITISRILFKKYNPFLNYNHAYNINRALRSLKKAD